MSELGHTDEPFERRRFGFDAARWAPSMQALDASPRNLPQLKRLLRHHSPLETAARETANSPNSTKP